MQVLRVKKATSSLENIFVGILCFGSLTLLLLSTSVLNNVLPSTLRKTPAASTSTTSLSQVYKEIGAKALDIGEAWPDSHVSNLLFQRDDKGAYLIPSFPEQDATLAVAALLHRSRDTREMLKEFDAIFASFLQDLRTSFCTNAGAGATAQDPNRQNSINLLEEELERYIWRIQEGTHHIVLAVFQEHPSLLLKESDKAKWYRVEEADAEAVYHKIASQQPMDNQLPSPRLKLDSMLLTRDGAMIAGFVDTTGSFQNIRASCLEIAHTVLGGGTSRPKNLIHVTMGRVLALPQNLNAAQRQGVAKLVHDYNTQILPDTVAKIMQSSQPQGASFLLEELTMFRDLVWTLIKIKEYGSWHLHS